MLGIANWSRLVVLMQTTCDSTESAGKLRTREFIHVCVPGNQIGWEWMTRAILWLPLADPLVEYPFTPSGRRLPGSGLADKLQEIAIRVDATRAEQATIDADATTDEDQ